MANEQSVACAPGQSKGRAMGEEVIYSLWIGFFLFFFVCEFCFVSSLTSPMLSRAREAHSQADGLSKIAYCLSSINGKRTWGEGVLVGAGLAARGDTT